MLGLDYLEELKESAKLPKEFEEFIEADDLLAQHDLIRLQVIKVTMFAIFHEEPFLNDVIKELEKSKGSGKINSYYTERLPSNDLFCCLRLLSPKCLWIVLEKLKSQHIGIVEDLMNAILNNDFNSYLAILKENEINIDPITPISKLLFINIRFDGLINSYLERVESIAALEENEVINQSRNILLQFLSEYRGIERDITPSLQDSIDVFEPLVRNIIDADSFRKKIESETFLTKEEFMESVIKKIKNSYPNFNEEGLSYEEYMNFAYMYMLQQYYEGICDFQSLSIFAKHVIENILKSDAFKSIWSKYDRFDEDMWEDLDKRIDEFFEKHGIIDEEEQEREESATADDNQTTESNAIITTKKAQQTDDDSKIQDFRDTEPKEKARILCPIIRELLETNKERVEDFLKDYDLEEVKGMIDNILIADAKEYTNIQREIIDDLSGTDHGISSRYYYKKRLWLLPFFQIIGRLFKKGVLVGKRKQRAFVKALFPEMRDKDPELGVVYKEEFDFIETCRSRVSQGNRGQPDDWEERYKWIDKCCE